MSRETTTLSDPGFSIECVSEALIEAQGWVPPDGPLFADGEESVEWLPLPEESVAPLSADDVAAWAAAAPLGSGLLTPWGVLDPVGLSDAGRIDALLACQRLRAWTDAQEQRLLAAMAPAPDPVDKGFVRDEIGCALRLAPAVVTAKLHTATQLVERLPATLGLLEGGDISLSHARVLVEAVLGLDDLLAAKVEARVLTRAAGQSVGAFRAAVHRAVLAVDPGGEEEQHRRQLEDRRVIGRPTGSGMGELWALLGVDDLAAVLTRLDTLTATKIPGDQRSADQRRADTLVALLLGTGTGTSTGDLEAVSSWQGRRPSVQVTVAASTMLGLDQHPGELDGYGPIPAAMARAIALDPTGTWRRLLTDEHGQLLDYGRTVYEPPQPLVDHVVARDRTCRFPGCRRPARRCEIDHQQAWGDGGITADCNCECLCPRHHHLKHETSWTVTGHPADELTWTSPTGHTYRAPPGQYDLPPF
jgi:hypothetical protein